MFTRSFAIRALAALAVFASSQSSFAAGFEKTISWSGKWNGLGGAAVAGATGAEALYFNPSGLAVGTQSEVSANLSPTFSQFSAPIGTAGADVDSEQQFSPIFGALGSMKINDKLGIGIGAYVGGGSKVFYENVGGSALNDSKTDLSLTELSVGAGYELAPGLRIGAAYRVSMVQATLITPVNAADLNAAFTGLPILQTRFDDMSVVSADGFRVGMGYDAAKWGLGVSYRSASKFTVEGDTKVQVESGTSVGADTFAGTVSAAGTLESQLPQQLNVGGWFAITDNFKTFVEYGLTHYAAVKGITTSTEFAQTDLTTLISGGAAPTALRQGLVDGFNGGLKTNWMNQHIGRIAFEYLGVTNYAIRAGFAYTSQVVPNNRARATFSSPGTGQSFTLGVGRSLGTNMMVNIAGEYSLASGTISAADATAAETNAGEFSTSAYAAHVGVSYLF